MRNPFKNLNKDYVVREIKNMEWQLEEMENKINKMKNKIRDFKKGCGLLK